LALKWVLVLLMVVDQVGSPMHQHRHDSGFDVAYLGAFGGSHHSQGESGATHADERVYDDTYAHSTLAIRQATASQLSVPPTDDDHVSWILISTVLAFLALASVNDKSLLRPFARWRAPCKTIYRSLPPAGRAPPLHA
jgi:hypothetical protein